MSAPTTTADQSTIDFDRAHLSWVTTGGSHGRWRVIASAMAGAAGSAGNELFVLTPLIMAGDVYGTGRLPMEPAYSYQFIGSSIRHAIIRDYPGANQGKDSAGLNSELFTTFEIYAPAAPGRRVDGCMATGSSSELWRLCACLRVIAKNGEPWQLEFPINHANRESFGVSTRFQIETGPILVPAALLEPGLASVCGGFALAFIYFNRLDQADLSLFGSLQNGSAAGRAYGVFSQLSGISIDLFRLQSGQM